MSLRFSDLPTAERRTATVDVPEFGDGMQVIVRELTVRDKSVLGAAMTLAGTHELAAAAVIAALCARDEDGGLVFGESRKQAIEYANNLPERFWPAITRISAEAIRLTAGDAETEAEAVEAAEKN
jgi:hypothetical protein